MKFTIEIYGAANDGAESLLYRMTISAFSPAAALRDTRNILAAWKSRGAISARVLNGSAETIYQISQ